MSIFSDFECGALTYEEYCEECKRLNRQDCYEREHDFDEEDEEEESEE